MADDTVEHDCEISASFDSPTWDVDCACGWQAECLSNYSVAIVVMQNHQREQRQLVDPTDA